jgi:hypothetical protein
MSIIHLVRANDDLISFCDCEQGIVNAPGQVDCPWCGCGWLFSCIKCRKAFAFAVAVELDTTWEALARQDLWAWLKQEPEQQDVDEWVVNMKSLTQFLELGKVYIYFDGYILPKDLKKFRMEGLKTKHQFDEVPQLTAMNYPEFKKNVLTNPDYWYEDELYPTSRH